MTTATEAAPLAPITDPNIADSDAFERDGLDAPEGVYRFRLKGVFGIGETNSGKKYLNVLYDLVERANYDEAGMLTDTTDISQRPLRLFHKFWIESGYGNAQLNSWLTATTGVPKGEFDPALGRYVFRKDAALEASIDQSAWNRVRHSKDDTYGWQVDIQRDFRKKPQGRIKVEDSGAQ